MEPMPPLEGAVYPPRVEPPTFLDRHPRVKSLVAMGFAAIWTALMVARLQRDGFSWLVVIALIAAASGLGYHFAKLEGPDKEEPSEP